MMTMRRRTNSFLTEVLAFQSDLYVLLQLVSSFILTLVPKDGVPRPLLPPIAPIHAGRKCLVLDLDETLVHSSFKVHR
jgi:RNA polymerase II subunit A small phosphatase-like protein